MKEGYLQQYAPPLEVYNNPANIFVADFVGSPTMNFIEGTGQSAPGGKGVIVKAPGLNLLFTPASAKLNIRDGASLTLGIRPEYIRVEAGGGVRAKIYAALPSGMETIVKIHLGGLLLTLVVFGAVDYPVDSEISVSFAGDNCVLFDRESGANLGLGKLTVV
jgi:multiple sugar transport system ATP-binding protein